LQTIYFVERRGINRRQHEKLLPGRFYAEIEGACYSGNDPGGPNDRQFVEASADEGLRSLALAEVRWSNQCLPRESLLRHRAEVPYVLLNMKLFI